MCLSITLIFLEEDFKKNLWVNWLESPSNSVALAHATTCHGWPDSQVLNPLQSFAINFRMKIIRSKIDWGTLPPHSPDSCTWVPQPGWRGTEGMAFYIENSPLFSYKQEMLWPSWAGVFQWDLVVGDEYMALTHGQVSQTPQGCSTSAVTTHRLRLRQFTSHFWRAEGVCVNISGDPYNLL